MINNAVRKGGLAVLGAGLALSLAACGGDSPGAAPSDDPTSVGSEAPDNTITLGFIPSWTDGRSVGNLLKVQLEEMGYTVETQELSEAGPLYLGLAQGDVDIYPSAWPEVTHASYMEEYGDRLESLGAYYDNAVLTWAVPEYSEIRSIEDIPDFADVLNNQIIGIEPGAGLTEASLDSVIPEYELDEFELVTSSTTAMLAELRNKVNREEEIVVTLWRPFWANAEFGMRDLEDPKGALGEQEALHFLATAGFAEQYPDIAEWVAQVKLDDEQYGSLEDTVVNQFEEGQEEEAVHAWMEANPGVLPEG
ncbi:MAG: glycine betaine ABC transporter substrate-binding protein [Tessaracoccus sp.]